MLVLQNHDDTKIRRRSFSDKKLSLVRSFRAQLPQEQMDELPAELVIE
jgi:hypothetical protein